ncbi:uncharacterized protein LACBIDRAFT_321621 [Laccaria bicolor S238N-H82]|uniref:Predicted protein n=1 Tax=Laccaria bicolor (strain S238N-H82 / ATCC MYA-4686) TaxID=486041 RepID=B0CTK3_LACBS|nr:uncharacterized protein LACBIDRAFT_321621 [Laccaria bicolor S238N-H82]EDR14505.1 predicted protein [Laccaria bicolor S238N-H82]|eukprot:XP_001875064.1 predicted protein [Laccaria bicolor S238N-H82]
MVGRLGYVPAADGNDTRRYLPRRNPSFAGYEQIPRLPPPPSYYLPPSIHNRYVSAQGRLWRISSPNSFQNPFCPGSRPTNLNLRVSYFEEQHRHYDGHMGPFDPTRNTQLWFPGKEWRALILTPAAVTPRDNPEYEPVTNCWKSDAAPAFDTGRIHPSYIDNLIHLNQQIRRFPLVVDWVMEAQQGLKDKRAFVDYVSRLQATPFWMPDANAMSRMADDRYLGVWLNGMDERQVRWYLKEGIPCFIKNKSPVKEPSTSHAAAWAWSGTQVQKDKTTTKEPSMIQTIDYGPPPLETVIIVKDRVPWIKPPPVKRAAPSQPGAPPLERKKWIKWVENYQPEGSFREVGAKFVPDHPAIDVVLALRGGKFLVFLGEISISGIRYDRKIKGSLLMFEICSIFGSNINGTSWISIDDCSSWSCI